MIDCHMHTPLCGHSRGEPEQFVAAAVAKKLEGIIITCHIPMEVEDFNPRGKTRMARSQLGDYRAWVDRARQEGLKQGIEVRYGIEAEIFPDDSSLTVMKEILAEEPFDFVLGSLHHHIPSYRNWLAKHDITTPREIVRHYFRHLREGIQTGLYDCLSHLDVIQVYNTGIHIDPNDYREEIFSVLEAVKAQDACIEINTSGLHKGIYQYHPGPVILRWAAELKVGLTMGSDAHDPIRVGDHFIHFPPFLKDIGHKEVYSYKNRVRQAHPL